MSLKPLGPVAAPLAAVYAGALAVRERVLGGTWRAGRRLPCPVVSVGNLTVGGTGKTPVVAFLAGALARDGRRVAIVSRGYGRTTRGLRVVADGREVRATVAEAGDEPVLLARMLPGVAVVVGEDRFAAGEHAVKALGADVIVLDDGFQHRQLPRDLDIVLLDASLDHEALRLLPAGPLREPLEALGRAQVVLLTRTERALDAPGLRALARRLAPGALVLGSAMRVTGLRSLDQEGGPRADLATLAGMRVLAVSGIGNPDPFEAELRERGAVLVGSARFGDHHAYTSGDVRALRERVAATGGSAVVTTAKDAVRLEGLGPLGFSVLVLDVVVEPEDPDALLARVGAACGSVRRAVAPEGEQPVPAIVAVTVASGLPRPPAGARTGPEVPR